MEVVQRQSAAAFRQERQHLRQGEDALNQLVKLALAHSAHSWCDALYRRAASYEPVRPLLPLAFGDVLRALLDALEPVPVLPDARFQLG